MKYLVLQIPGNSGNINLVAPAINIIPPTNIHAGNPATLNSILSVMLNLAILGAIIVCFFMLILAGFGWMTSQGDKQKLANARQRLVMAIIGLIVVFISFVIINIIYTFFGIGTSNFLGSF